MARPAALPITLALQGGGAHGAFTWGVLDRLLEEPGLEIAGVSGTSAGAMNAIVLAQGLLHGDREIARAELAGFWRRISEIGMAAFNPYQSTPVQAISRAWNIDYSPATMLLDVVAQFVSPYQLNPLDRNPMRDLLHELIDFEALNAAASPKVFVCATNLQTNAMRIFTNGDLSTDALLASACLPQLHRAVEVDDAYYWDGGFIGNPVLKPLIRQCPAADLLLVQINPLQRRSLPITSRDIMDRLNEVTMNAALVRELDVVATLNDLIRDGSLKSERYRLIRLHRIADPEVMSRLGLRSKNNTAWPFLTYLRDAGRTCTGRWLEANRAKLGHEATFDPGQLQT
jgi:NTE family protein